MLARGALAGGGALLGFVSGTVGLFEQQVVPLDAAALAGYRSQGGYHLLGRSVDRVRSARDQEAALAACSALALDGLVVIGGTYSNTDAAHLAEFFKARGSRCRVVGVPVTIDGDVHNNFVETTVGFDTATKVYAQLVGNMATDGNSAKKYWYYVKLMGRAVSRVALEVALQTHPNAVVLGEDIEARKLTLCALCDKQADRTWVLCPSCATRTHVECLARHFLQASLGPAGGQPVGRVQGLRGSAQDSSIEVGARIDSL